MGSVARFFFVYLPAKKYYVQRGKDTSKANGAAPSSISKLRFILLSKTARFLAALHL